MRILHLNLQKTWGGGEHQTLMLIKGLEELGFENHLLLRKGSQLEGRVTRELPGLTLHQARASIWPAHALCKDVRGLEEQYNYRVVHSHTGREMRGLWGARHALKVAHRRVPDPISISAGLKYNRVDALIAVSSAIKTGLVTQGIRASRISVIHDCVNCTSQTSIDLKLPGSPRILYLGRLLKHKGLHVLIRAFNSFRKHYPKAVLYIVGEGPQRSKLVRLVQALALKGSVVFTGFQQNPEDWIASVDCLSLASLHEGLGSVVLQAQSQACPVVVSNCGGLPETIADGRTGLLSEAGDPQSLCKAFLRLFADPNLQQQMKIEGPRRILQHFSQPEITRQTAALYNSALACKDQLAFLLDEKAGAVRKSIVVP